MVLRIKYNKELAEELKKIAGDASKCYQCGTCTGDCPTAWLNPEFNPRKMVLMASWGMEEILKSNIPWLCTACFKCTTRCPKEVRPSDVIASIRTIAIRERLAPEGAGLKFEEAYTEVVKESGELDESALVTKVMGLTGAMRMMPLGMAISMLRKKKVSLPIFHKKASSAEEVKKIFEAVGETK